MSDNDEVYPILLDSNNAAISCTKSEAGEVALGKVGPTSFVYQDVSGNLVLPSLNASGNLPVSEAHTDVFISTRASEATLTNNTQTSQLVNAAGSAVTIKPVNVQISGTDNSIVTQSVIHGVTTGGGGGYVDVKVTPSGALVAEVTQGGPWNISNITGTISLPTGAATEATLLGVSGRAASIDTDIDVALSTRASEATLSGISGHIAQINSEINNNYGVATGAIRTASQIGNISGAADFGLGARSNQTLRVTFPSENLDAFDGVKTGGNFIEVSGTGAALNATPIASTDVSRFKSINLTITGTFVASYAFEQSHDNVNWIAAFGTFQQASNFTPLSANTASGFSIHIPVQFKFFRVRITGYVSGTVSCHALITTFDSSFIGARSVVLYNAAGVAADYGAGDASATTLRNVRSNDVISTANSTTANLGIAGVFTGTNESHVGFADIGVLVFADQAGSIMIQYSGNGGVSYVDGDTYTISAMVAGDGKWFRFPPEGSSYRIVYTNGGVAQTSFTLQTRLFRFASSGPSHRIESTFDGQNDAGITLAITRARQVSGTFDNVRSTNLNDLGTADILIGTTGTQGTITVGTTATQVPATPLANRKVLVLVPNGTGYFYGFSNAVTAANGIPLTNGVPEYIRAASTCPVWVIRSLGSTTVRHIETP